MGYSIMIPFETEQDKNKMELFLEQHFRSLKEVISHLPIRSPQLSDGYPPHDNLGYTEEVTDPFLGYNYRAGVSEEERDYFYSICYWMGIHGGKRENDRPILIYDGFQKWNIHINEPGEAGTEWVEVNEFGYRKMSKLREIEHFPKMAQLLTHAMKKRLETIDAAIYDELKRLSTLWKEQQ